MGLYICFQPPDLLVSFQCSGIIQITSLLLKNLFEIETSLELYFQNVYWQIIPTKVYPCLIQVRSQRVEKLWCRSNNPFHSKISIDRLPPKWSFEQTKQRRKTNSFRRTLFRRGHCFKWPRAVPTLHIFLILEGFPIRSLQYFFSTFFFYNKATKIWISH